jgi:hypothetical protein
MARYLVWWWGAVNLPFTLCGGCAVMALGTWCGRAPHHLCQEEYSECGAEDVSHRHRQNHPSAGRHLSTNVVLSFSFSSSFTRRDRDAKHRDTHDDENHQTEKIFCLVTSLLQSSLQPACSKLYNITSVILQHMAG